jgi:NAD(P)-dependent dehydrogenase (short-subunit alcohol dehydrogenase family)
MVIPTSPILLQSPIASPFGPKSEPAEIMAGIDLKGRKAIVTGGYSGLGIETVRALAVAGAEVTVPARSEARARQALAGIAGVAIAAMDLGDIAMVRTFAQDWASQNSHLDLLINNAGVGVCPEARVGPGWESQFGINHMGHFALTEALMPKLVAADSPRVITLSSAAHRMSDICWEDIQFERNPYDKWRAYGQAKTANALFSRALHLRLNNEGGYAFSVHPGGILTPLQRHLSQEEMQQMGWLDENGELSRLAREHLKSPTQGCTTTLWAATSPMLLEHGGEYCEDCDIARVVPADGNDTTGVCQHAIDPESAERLWSLSERLLADV